MKQTTPALIDEKDVMTDWVQDVFDSGSCVTSGCQALGFIDEHPVYVHWQNNTMIWQIVEDCDIDYKVILSEIKQRLLEFEDPESEVFSEMCVFNHFIMQFFYYK